MKKHPSTAVPSQQVSALEEKQLIEAAKNGNQEAMSDLYHLHVKAIYHYVYARVGDASTAEDITSDVFVRAIETLPQYEKREVPFRGWLYWIAHGKVVNHYQYMKHRSGNLNLEDLQLASEDDPEEQVSERLYQDHILEYLQQLNDSQQQVLFLRFIQEHSISATAKLVGKSESAIKSLQLRALQALSKLLDLDRAED